jgi:simple sugar transport system permease protein
MESIIPILKTALIIMTPLLFAAAGGLLPALAGTLNIALEGLLLIGAFVSLTVFYVTGSVTAAVAAAAFAAAGVSALHAFSAFKLRANVFIAGIAVNLLTSGLCIVISQLLFNTKGVITARNIQGIAGIYLIIAIFLLVIIWVVINKTPFGYRLRACEKNTEALLSLGINVQFYKTTAILVSGFLCGIGGSFLSLNLGSYVPGMSAGKGWIALVVIFLGGKKPFGVFAAAFIYSIAESYSIHAQGLWKLPADFILAFPYICTLIALIVISIFPGVIKSINKKLPH